MNMFKSQSINNQWASMKPVGNKQL